MELIINGLEGLGDAARELVPALRERGGVVALYGAMGAGKTTLVSALMREMGSSDEVTSPTFALINEYLAADGEPVYHFDFYRISDKSEAFDMGYEEYFFSGRLCLVEWPEKIEELIPEDALKIYIEVMPDDSRKIELLIMNHEL